MNIPKAKRARRASDHVIYPNGLQARWDISLTTRWRMERDGRIPARDFYIGGRAVGWHTKTIEAAERASA